MTDDEVRTMTETPLRIAILGSPSRPAVDWTPENLSRLVDLGFTAVQVNIAWSYRPGGEPLNLEDVVDVDGPLADRSDAKAASRAHWIATIAERGRLAHDHRLRTIFHFGAPFQAQLGITGEALPQCISDPATTERYVRALAELADAAPAIDDVLLYTYDQDAWLCSEFSGCDRCAGVPLDRRLPAFLESLASGWRSARPDGRMWWEPWELSAGQLLACLARVPADGFGLMLHSSIAEVMTTNPADPALRNAAALAASRGIPVVGEVFVSSGNEEVEPWTALPVPLVTLRQVRVVEAVPGVTGVKEYFGIVPGEYDVNLAAAAEHFAEPGRGDDDILSAVADRFGANAPWLPGFWSMTSRAYQLYPWDASWFAREIARSHVQHSLTAATVRGMQSGAPYWETPAWRSTRRSLMMRTENSEPHPWLLEDVGLRFGLAADEMQRARDAQVAFADDDSAASRAIARQLLECEGFITRCRSYAAHIRETGIAHALRRGAGDRDALVAELRGLLTADVANISRELALRDRGLVPADSPSAEHDEHRWVVAAPPDDAPFLAAIELLDRDVDAFLATHFLEGPDRAEMGQFTLTSR